MPPNGPAPRNRASGADRPGKKSPTPARRPNAATPPGLSAPPPDSIPSGNSPASHCRRKTRRQQGPPATRCRQRRSYRIVPPFPPARAQPRRLAIRLGFIFQEDLQAVLVPIEVLRRRLELGPVQIIKRRQPRPGAAVQVTHLSRQHSLYVAGVRHWNATRSQRITTAQQHRPAARMHRSAKEANSRRTPLVSAADDGAARQGRSCSRALRAGPSRLSPMPLPPQRQESSAAACEELRHSLAQRTASQPLSFPHVLFHDSSRCNSMLRIR